MNILVGNSRGAGLRELIPKSTLQISSYIPGAKVSNLGNLALKLHSNSNSPDNTHVYFIAGITDLTKKLKGQNYEEVIFTEDINLAVARVSNTLSLTKSRLSKLKVKAIFCTINTMHIEKWNLARKQQSKTTYLQYTNQYDQMQINLNKAIDMLNSKIIELNKQDSHHTPLLHQTIKHPKGHGKYFYKYNLLVDGVHGNQTAKKNGPKASIKP